MYDKTDFIYFFEVTANLSCKETQSAYGSPEFDQVLELYIK